MSLESRQFERYRPDVKRMVKYGFSPIVGGYRYSCTFMDGSFRADITVPDSGEVFGKVIDLDTDEEYYAVHSSDRYGPFVSTVRDAYCAVLQEIADHCFVKMPFVFPQSNRITDLIKERFGEEADFPFEKLDGYGVFRYKDNKKWYALIMIIPRARLEMKKENNYPDTDEMIEIVNVKIDPTKREQLLKIDGIYPCYHMNQEKWISVALDDRVPDEDLMDLIRRSREYAIRSTGKRHSEIHNGDWILAVSPTYYDVEQLFAENEEEQWKQSNRKIRCGDAIYLYIGAPVSAVLYECRVLETNIPYSYDDGSISVSRVMRLKKIREFDRDQVPVAQLKKLGIQSVHGCRAVTGEFLDYIRSAK